MASGGGALGVSGGHGSFLGGGGATQGQLPLGSSMVRYKDKTTKILDTHFLCVKFCSIIYFSSVSEFLTSGQPA